VVVGAVVALVLEIVLVQVPGGLSGERERSAAVAPGG
jgi:hypothetical protein